MATSKAASSAHRSVVGFLTRVLAQPEKQGRIPLPFRPISRDEVPAAAWSELERSCGSLALERLLVIPSTGKGTAPQLPSRTRVLAFGEGAVGHWTEDEAAGVVECMPIEDVLAVDDRIVLLYGRLSLIGTKSQMAVQYNAVARPQLRENILWLRGTIAGPKFPARPSFIWLGAEGEERPQSELPYKWAYMLAHRDDLRIDPTADEMIAVGDVVELGTARGGPSTGIALLGPRELVVAAEPPADRRTHRYGVDLTVVPRAHIRDVGWSCGNLQIRLRAGDEARPADEPAISMPLDGRLFEAMRRSFGAAVEWARP